MKLISCLFGLICSTSLLAADADAGKTFHGSCQFEGIYASGCIEFYDGTWDDASTQQYCQDKSRPGATAVTAKEACNKEDFNSLCASKMGDNLADIYVNDMPSFICKKYMKGVLTTRPANGW